MSQWIYYLPQFHSTLSHQTAVVNYHEFKPLKKNALFQSNATVNIQRRQLREYTWLFTKHAYCSSPFFLPLWICSNFDFGNFKYTQRQFLSNSWIFFSYLSCVLYWYKLVFEMKTSLLVDKCFENFVDVLNIQYLY